MPIRHRVDRSPDPRPNQDVKNGKRSRLHVFHLLKGRKSCKLQITAVCIGGIAANASFPPLAAEEIWKMLLYRRYKQRYSCKCQLSSTLRGGNLANATLPPMNPAVKLRAYRNPNPPFHFF